MPFCSKKQMSLYPFHFTINQDDHPNSPPTSQVPIPNKSLFIAPSIYVNSDCNYSTLTKHLLELVQPSCIQFKSALKYLIICTDNAPNYNLVLNYLMASELITFHTYQVKIAKLYSLYIRHLNLTTSTQDVQSSLINEGHEVIRVTNIINRLPQRTCHYFQPI